MLKFAALAGIALAATSLAGCQSSGSSALSSAGSVDMGEYFEQRLAVGRLHLAANRPTKAITAFRQAAYDPRYAGEAYNGMAIAYDRIGRADLAERYFAEAVKASPGDERFARNLARFEGREIMLAQQASEAPAEVAVADIGQSDLRGPVRVEPHTQQLRGPVHVENAPEVKVARTSPGQVSLGTKAQGSSVRMVERIEEPARITVQGMSNADRVMQRVRRSAQARRGYPIRIVLRDDSTKRP